MEAPDSMVFLTQAAPWSVSSGGPKEAEAVAVELKSDADFSRYRGTLRGKVALLGPLRELTPATAPFIKHWTDAEVLSGVAVQRQRGYQARRAHPPPASPDMLDFGQRKARFLAEEGVAAVVVASSPMPTKGGETGLIVVDDSPLGTKGWSVETQVPFPLLITSVEDFGRAWRLALSGEKPRLQFDVDTAVLDSHEHGFDVIGEIPGEDAKLRNEVVILGAHLDSWPAATGATDNGAGVAATLEVLRILKAAGAKPRRTIRFILYSGEEEGLLGSSAYVAKHIARTHSASHYREGEIIPAADLKPLEDYQRVSAAYNIDDGSGRILGVFSGGNPALAKIFSDWLPEVEDLGVVSVLDEKSYFSDGAPYQSVGLPGISFLQDELDYFTRTHHTNLDTLEHIVPSDLAQAASVAAVFVLKTADFGSRLPRPSSSPP
jgi:Iap family predicted aminopeptidase